MCLFTDLAALEARLRQAAIRSVADNPAWASDAAMGAAEDYEHFASLCTSLSADLTGEAAGLASAAAIRLRAKAEQWRAAAPFLAPTVADPAVPAPPAARAPAAAEEDRR